MMSSALGQCEGINEEQSHAADRHTQACKEYRPLLTLSKREGPDPSQSQCATHAEQERGERTKSPPTGNQ